MNHIEIFQIDAFTDKVFYGNPAAVCLLDEWLNDELMQAIAVENNLSETAFIMENDKGFHIRWFTPKGEISLCGHATLAAGFVLFELGRCDGDTLSFTSLSGPLAVNKKADQYALDFPCLNYSESNKPDEVLSVLNLTGTVYESELDYLVELEDEKQVARAQVDLIALAKLPKRGLIISSRSETADFYSRCFYPRHNIPEDPVTGSAHCVLTPFWSEKLNKTSLSAVQGSYRKGFLFCELKGDRVSISGHCKWYSKGHLMI